MVIKNKTLQVIGSKLGLGDEEQVLCKADELERLLQTKSTAGCRITDTSRVVICLDLAASLFNADFDVKSAMKYAGLKPTAYNNLKKTVENLLVINKQKLTISALCLTFNCTSVQNLADKILYEYCRQSKVTIDLNLPQYVCMAMFQACRINNVKIPKSKIIVKSGLKPTQWTKMDSDWTKFVNQKFSVQKKRGKSAKNVEQYEKEIPAKMDVDIAAEKEKSKPVIESYEEWKRRMLEQAYKELRELEIKEGKKQSLSPRKSPRKNCRYSPYKSPTKKTNGVCKKINYNFHL